MYDDLLGCLDTFVPVPTSSLDMSKDHYVRSLIYGPDAVSSAAGLPADPQTALKDDLRNGRRPTYWKDALTARAIR